MASLAIAGTKGRVFLPGTPNHQIAGLKQWDITVDAPTYDASVLGDIWVEVISGLKKWTGTLTGFYEINTDPNGQFVLWTMMINSTYPLIEFEAGDGSLFQGEVVVTQGKISDPVNNIMTLDWTFEGTGQLIGPFYG